MQMQMQIEIINTGSELMLGRVINTHQAWLCRRLADRGYEVARQAAVADNAAHIGQAVREALARADLVLVTGGLGPTCDDLTRDAIAGLFGLRLIEHPAVWTHIQTWFTSRNRPLPQSTRVQALVPEGAVVLHNRHGTAPGLLLHAGPDLAGPNRHSAWLCLLPGPPRELRPMFLDQVLPWLLHEFPLDAPFVARTLRTTGIGESMAQEAIAAPLENLVSQGLEVGYCARTGEVDIRLAARGSQAAALVNRAVDIVLETLGPRVFAQEEELLEAVIIKALAERGRTLVAAESCTGGRVANRVTDVPGASAVFLGGAVTYSNPLKQDVLGVRAETLDTHGAVSEPTAREMAEGARKRFGADYAIAVTGIAGPSGGTDAKPVGTVFVALASPSRTVVERYLNRYDRETFKQVTSQQALEMLRRELIGMADAATGSHPARGNSAAKD